MSVDLAGWRWLDPTKWVALAAVAVKLPRIALKAIAAVRCKLLDFNALMTIAVAGAAHFQRLRLSMPVPTWCQHSRMWQ